MRVFYKMLLMIRTKIANHLHLNLMTLPPWEDITHCFQMLPWGSCPLD